MALSPRRPGQLNFQTAQQEEPSGTKEQLSRSSSSSPFQSDVASCPGQENRFGATFDMSPSKSARMNQKFEIFDDNTAPLPPANISPSRKNRFNDSLSVTEPASIPLPESSPFKNSLRGSSENGWAYPDNRDEEMDTKSVASDDTRFSNFSAVPNADMTLFATLGSRTPGHTSRSPRKHGANVEQTPRGDIFMTPATSRRTVKRSSSRPGSPTPRQNRKISRDASDTTNLLLDFTQQLEMQNRRGTSPGKSTTEPNLLSFIQSQRNPSPSKPMPKTPSSRNMLNLLDFDLPPQPTPRSIPTITVRELESLKSSYLSEISSLKASLSGREAEVASLKRAVGDAERRVGEAQERLREESTAREDAVAARSEWEKKGQEVQALLAKVKDECLHEEREKEELLRRLEESQKARDEAELRADAAASKANVAQSEVGLDQSDSGATDALVASRVAAQLDEKMENLARELHAVYKKKHESKVATLKKTYETRSDKRCGELNDKIDELTKQNEELQAAKDSNLSIEIAASKTSRQPLDLHEDGLKLKAELEEQRATIAGLMKEMGSVRETHASMLKELESERIEKGELVAAVDEMLSLQAEIGVPNAVEDFKKSIGVGGSRPSLGNVRSSGAGLDSKPGKSLSGASGLPSRSGSHKSRMMSSIERMGHGRAGS